MSKPIRHLAILLTLSGALAAQCSTLSITGSINPGQTLAIAVSGAGASDACFLAVAQSAGSTNLSFGPLGTLMLNVDAPVLFFPLGTTDAAGNVSLSFNIPALPAGAGAPPIPMQTFQCQAATIGLPSLGGGPGGFGGMLPQLSFCTSNLATLQVGS